VFGSAQLHLTATFVRLTREVLQCMGAGKGYGGKKTYVCRTIDSNRKQQLIGAVYLIILLNIIKLRNCN
jgi:hypothetical protein